MRTLTSVRSVTNIVADLEFHLTASDQSTTWVFGKSDIKQLSRLSWEVPFLGGIARPSNYSITLASSSEWVRDFLYKTVKGEAFLKVYVNSDDFTPHVGRVRGIERDGFDPNRIQLKVFDNFLDADPKFPLESIVDSYSTVHPQIIASDMGYPVYYGRHKRPFYMTPVDCSISSMLGPRNVSSENHVSSMYYAVDVQNSGYVFMSNGGWDPDTNVVSNDFGFEVHEIDLTTPLTYEVNRTSFNVLTQGGGVNGWCLVSCYSVPTIPVQNITAISNSADGGWFLKETFVPKIAVKRATTHNISSVVSFNTYPNSGVDQRNFFYTDTNTVFVLQRTTSTWSWDEEDKSIIRSFDVSSFFDQRGFFYKDSIATLESRCIPKGSVLYGNVLTFSNCHDLYLQLESAVYKNYHAVVFPVNCSDIAYSFRPWAIIYDIAANYIGWNVFNQAQMSSLTSSYEVQCFFGERQNVSDIFDEFGQMTATYIWFADSGDLKCWTYENSASVTPDFNLTMQDFNSLSIKDSPLGTTSFQTAKAKRVKLDYDYNFTTGEYESTMVADPSNSPACNSAQAAGVDKEVTIQSKYIMDTLTASLCLNNFVKKLTQENMVVTGNLPARFFQMEVADTFKLDHPTFPNSFSVFQITAAEPNFLTGDLDITAYQLITV